MRTFYNSKKHTDMLPKALSWRVTESVFVSLFLSLVVFLPQWRYGFNWSDEGLLWYLSQRIHSGEIPIRDFFGYDPGRYLWSAAWFKIFGNDGLFEQRFANAIFGAIGLGAAYAAMMACDIKRPNRIATIALLAIALGYPQHKVYEQSLSLIAVALTTYSLLGRQIVKRWLVFGLSTGLAAIVGRNSGVYFALSATMALAITWRTRSFYDAKKSFFSFLLGVAVGYAPIILWLALDQRFLTAFVESIRFTPQWQLPLPIPFPWRVPQNWTSISGVQVSAVSWLCVTVFAIYAVTTIRVGTVMSKRCPLGQFQILEISGLCAGLPYLHQGFERADFSHIAQGILPVFLIAVARWAQSKVILAKTTYVVLLCLSLAAWIPLEPCVRAKIQLRKDPISLVHFDMGGKDFIVGRGQSQVLSTARREFERCRCGDGQFIAMPHYPGIFAYLHTRSPYWEMYFLYKRSEEFQLSEILVIKARQSKVAIINPSATIDGRDDLRINHTNPILAGYIRSHFERVFSTNDMPSNFELYERACSK